MTEAFRDPRDAKRILREIKLLSKRIIVSDKYMGKIAKICFSFFFSEYFVM